MRGHKTNRVEIHKSLWSKADRFGKVTIYQKQLAQELGVTQATMSTIVHEMIDEGRLKKVAAKLRNIGVYAVRDPADFEHPFDPVIVPGIGVARCRECHELETIGKHALQLP